MKGITVVLAFSCCIALTGCSTLAYTNNACLWDEVAKHCKTDTRTTLATFEIKRDRGREDVLVLLALSGGGSRAAYFSGRVMTQLQTVFGDYDLLTEVDAISAVSGGALPAAYYSISADRHVRLSTTLDIARLPPSLQKKVEFDDAKRTLQFREPLGEAEVIVLNESLSNPNDRRQVRRLWEQREVVSGRMWDDATVSDLMSRNYIAKWIANWFWLDNIFSYWFTSYDRTDIMAQTFADNMYDTSIAGVDLTFSDFNLERPYLILNATNGTERVDGDDMPFGEVFTFTREDFGRYLASDIHSYSVARAVMASATFPMVFQHMTLLNYRQQHQSDWNPRDNKPRYMHVFDGGNADNIGLRSLKRILLGDAVKRKDYKAVIVILVDSFTRSRGVDRNDYDPRDTVGSLVDVKTLSDAVDSLLEQNRDHLLEEFRRRSFLPENEHCDKPSCKVPFSKLFFYHVHLNDPKLNKLVDGENLRDKLNKIPTHFRLTSDSKTGKSNSVWIDRAVERLINTDNECLQRIRVILDDPKAETLVLDKTASRCGGEVVND